MARKRGKNGIMTTTASRRTTDRAAGESGRRGGGTRDAWATLQELAGPASLWPRLIRRLFWTRRLRNADRAVLCAFCFVNGLPPGLVLDWSGGCVPIFGDESARRHFVYVHEALSAGRYPYLYAYNVSQNRYERATDGAPRRYVNRRQRLAEGSRAPPGPSARC